MGLSRDYVCCAIPMHNAGIYVVLGQFFVVAFTTGILCFTAPSIVAVSIPSFGAALLGGICIVIAVIQAWGAWTVHKCQTKQLYARISMPAIGIALLLAMVWIIISGVNHNSAVTACLAQFLGNNASNVSGTTTINGVAVGSSGGSGRDICNIFTWVQLGVMIFLFIFILIAELYFFQVLRIFGVEQRLDSKKYNSVLSQDAMGFRAPKDDFSPMKLEHTPKGSFDSSIAAQPYKPSALRYESTASYDDPYKQRSGSTKPRGPQHGVYDANPSSNNLSAYPPMAANQVPASNFYQPPPARQPSPLYR